MTLDELRRNGIAQVDSLNPLDALETMEYLRSCQRYACHVERDRKPYAGGEVACWSMESVLAAPHFLEFALTFTELAAEYLAQYPPRMYSVNAFETYPSEVPLNRDIQEFHHDKDDSRFVALFVYLTDVNSPADGAHQYQLGTHHTKQSRGTVDICGPIGTAFLSDGRGQHRGLRPEKFARVMAWARWGVSNPPAAYIWDHMRPVSKEVLGARYPLDRNLQESIRLVVQ